ncbi:MAG: PorP/SprF family type IX secretion system membrane protein [Bacteroidia bacterium]|jgi:type IX secretion system PorP/SprF family membrane protein
MRRKILLATIILSAVLMNIRSSFAQDIHFTQTTMIPLVLNPALTGTEGDQRAFLNYKNQWRGLSANGAAFNTAFFSVDGAFMKKRWERAHVGVGITGFKDVAGDLKMGTTQINLSLAGVVHINANNTLSGGLQGGYVQKSVSVAAMQWESQYNPSIGGFDPNILSNDVSALPPTRYGDFSLGLAWGYASEASSLGANDQLRANFGFSAQNVNTPKQNYTDITNDQLYAKFVVHGNALIGVPQSDLAIVPSMAYFIQGPSSQLNVGTMIRMTIKEKSKYTGVYKGTAVSFGAHYRLKDAIAPMVLLEHSNYSFGLSYDVNVSGLTAATRGKGGIEISLKYVNPNPFHSAPRLLDDED